jgi:signal transduction histidine kinase
MIPAPLRRISVRLTFWYSGLLLLMVALLGVALYMQLDRALRAEMDQSLREDAQYGLTLVELEHGTLVWEGTEQGRIIPDPLPRIEHQELYRLIDAQGQVISGVAWEKQQLGGARMRVYNAPVLKAERLLGVLQMFDSLAPVDHTLAQVSQILGGGGLLALVLSLAGGQFLARRALGPVAAITRAARAIGATNLSQRLRLPDVGDELSELSGSFDEMLDRVEEAYRRQREFAADASHELRTPLALIKGEASLARQAGGDPEAMQAALSTIEAEADSLTRLVEDLLLLARLDRGELLRADPVGLDELAHEVEGRFRKMATRQGVLLRVDASEAVLVRGDETALRRVLINLTQNALQHTVEGGIWLRINGADEARIEVIDTGCGIPPADQPRVFDRFYRGDAARRRGGTGLGLALCREIILAHGGSILLESDLGRGTRVICRLPLLAAPRR